MLTSPITSIALAAVALAGGAAMMATRSADRTEQTPALTVERPAAAKPEALPAYQGPLVFSFRAPGKETVKYDLNQLDAMPQVKLTREEPFVKRTMTFTGVPIAELLTYLGAPPKGSFAVTAHDGYKVRLDIEALVKAGALLATRADGQAIRIAKGGPSRLVFPASDQAVTRNTDNWIWSIKSVVLK